ncbi:hypothetical protein [Metaclostridioides mangenotii]|nr:hypothetical protein [Clostridioides mangenotii]
MYVIFEVINNRYHQVYRNYEDKELAYKDLMIVKGRFPNREFYISFEE